jgi:hypothetical protein
LLKKTELVPYDFKEKKYHNWYLLLNDFISDNQDLLVDSKIIYNSSIVFEEMGIIQKNIDNLKETNHFLPFLVLSFSIYLWYKGEVISQSFNPFEKPAFKNDVDILLFNFVEKYQDKQYNDFVKDLKATFSNGKSDEFLKLVWDILNMYAKRFSWTGSLL